MIKDCLQSRKRAWYTVAILNVAAVSALIDRQILAMIVEPIKRDFRVSDTEVSLLIGFSFALFYTLMGLPFGYLADSKSRRNLIMLGISLWSAFTILSGLTKTFSQMLIARLGVGFGEASLMPCAISMISDLLPKEKRPTAMGVYRMGTFMGSGVALIISGLVVQAASKQDIVSLPFFGDIRSWQIVFFYIGLPGFLLVLLVSTIREPIRKDLLESRDHQTPGRKKKASFADFINHLRANWRTFCSFYMGFSFLVMMIFGKNVWLPTLLIRSHEWTPREVGLKYGSIHILFSLLGIFAGGRFAERLAQKGYHDANVRVALYNTSILIPCCILFPLMPTDTLLLAILIPTTFLDSFHVGGIFAALQEIVPNQMRGQAVALQLLLANLIGAGLGPLFIALITDYFFKDPLSLKYSMAIALPIMLAIALILFSKSLKPFRETKYKLDRRLAVQS